MAARLRDTTTGWNWKSRQSIWSRVRLKFDVPETEAAFLSQRAEELVRWTRNGCMAYMAFASMLLVYRVLNWETDMPERVSQYFLGSTIIIAILELGLVWTRRHIHKIMRLWMMEGMLCLNSIVLFLIFAASNPTFMLQAGLFQSDVSDCEEKLGPRREVIVQLLVLQVVSCTVHTILPMRWLAAAFVDVIMFVQFVSISWLLTKSLDFSFIGMAAFLVVIPSRAGWVLEHKERTLFQLVAFERTRRAKAEFTVERTKQLLPVAKDVEHNSDALSLPRTTATGELFTTAISSLTPTSYEQLVRLGLQEHWLIGSDEVKLSEDSILGKGGFSVVFSGIYCRGEVAIKKHEPVQGRNEQKFQQSMCNELRILRHIRHPNIVLLHGACLDQENCTISLVMERVQGLALHDLAAQGWSCWSTPDKIDIAHGICLAAIYLHSRRPVIVHADLKPSNVIIELRGTRFFPKIVDFGMSCVLTCTARLRGGTAHWVAPEVAQNPGMRPTPAADVFSISMVLYFLACGRKPHERMTQKEVIRAKKKTGAPALEFKPLTPLLEAWAPCIEQCCCDDALARMTAEEVYDAVIDSQASKDVSEASNLEFGRGNTGNSFVSL